MRAKRLVRFAETVCSVALAACTPAGDPPKDDGGDDDGTSSPTVVLLTPTQHLTRASLVLRGIRPSIEELTVVDRDPTQLAAIVDRYLGSPEFGDTMMDLHNESLLLRTNHPLLVPLGFTIGATFDEMAGIFDEPLQLIRDVVMTDQPYTKIVTADYTMANATVAKVWGLAHAGDPAAWTRASWPDGRDAAGILSSSIVFERWRSTGFNFNRGRANMISRALLCHNYLDADIEVDNTVDLSDPDAVARAVVENPTCAGCHQTLDPLASYLFPHKAVPLKNYPANSFDPRLYTKWMTTNQRAPMFFGRPADKLAGLGQAIADDPRFARCAVIHFASYFTEVPEADLDGRWIAELQAGFATSNFNAKQLAKQIVLSRAFRVSHDSDAARGDRIVGLLKLRPEQLARTLRDLTGFEWTTDATDHKVGNDVVGVPNLLASDFLGFRALAGGIDSFFITHPVFTMNAPSSLVTKTAATAAANHVVDHDANVAANARTLFTVAAPTASDEPAVRAQLAYLHGRIYGELVTANDPLVDQTFALFGDALAATGDAKRAWKLTLIGMLRDLRSQFY